MKFLKDAKYLRDYVVGLTFEDDLYLEVDLKDQLEGEAFRDLKELAEFAKVRFSDELETIVWPNGADLAPEFLYDLAKLQNEETGR